MSSILCLFPAVRTKHRLSEGKGDRYSFSHSLISYRYIVIIAQNCDFWQVFFHFAVYCEMFFSSGRFGPAGFRDLQYAVVLGTMIMESGVLEHWIFHE